MAEMTPAAEAIAGLLAGGWTYAEIGRSLGINGSSIRQAIHPSPGQRQKPLAKYVPVLQQLQGTAPGTRPATLPERRKTKSGNVASVRKGIREFKTKQGETQYAARVKKGSATLQKLLDLAAQTGKNVRWDVLFQTIRTISDATKSGWVTGKLPDGWTAATLLSRIAQPQQGDSWKPGDVSGALIALAKEQNEGVVSATGGREFSIFTIP
ncbi:hypothetical protein [Dictyobacter aurantiacus]|uniref:Uncharacterized protein n=1 Tax=Dictyobacter aurantiacus TaxID=1936993 RepID=A0A401Z768_9CHLR|nr:hypothetical protein [Dictyobacter aurantiacus]GCE02675.1 hypothetical protein KDAU_00040 [Dictyobacter aurantiacus]GCE07772.1 hypothetical protein KDAU_51010 [Dictyobacter aurantiacus]GCE07779.1 hypothetical protein KDAU_51080 [Dictyobacter aurantiacus]GCE10138.1 hypothetical protein KDAU_74670 [Dictyobacter aurantiacus]